MSQQKLKAARGEIEAILKKHDIAGFVQLHAPGWGETFWNIWPSYSVLVGDFPSIRIRSKLADYGGNMMRQAQHQAETAQMVHVMGTSMAQCSMQFLELSQAVDAVFGSEHQDQGFKPDPSISNSGAH